MTVHSEKIKTKYDSYSSFVIKCNYGNVNKLLNADLWPVGSLIRKYYE